MAVAAADVPSDEQVDRDRPARWPVVLGGLVIGVVVMLAVMAATGGTGPRYAGLPDAGPVTGWLLPVARYGSHVLAAATVGMLLMAVVLLPVRGQALSKTSHRAVRAASASAALWAVAALLTAFLTLSDILGQPLSHTLRPDVLGAFLMEFPQTAGYVLVAVGASVLAMACYVSLSSGTALALLVAALLVTTPPALTGHASAAANHDIATSGALIHTLAVAVWVGGLLAVTWFGLAPRHGLSARGLGTVASRFSRIAVWCFALVALGGVLSAAVRLFGLADLVTTTYGRLLLVKVLVLAVLGVIGFVHRRRTLPAVHDGVRGAFLRLLAVEWAVMAAAVGVAVALARTVPPVPDDPQAYADQVGGVLGYTLTPDPTAWDLLTTWRIEPLVTTLLLIAAVAYGLGVRRLVRRGIDWPVGRTVSWAIGLSLLFLATSSGIGAYSPAMFSTHMVQHMTMSMFGPIALALAAPVTLALRALPPAASRPDGDPGVRGPREWLLVVLHARFTRILLHPVVVFTLFVSATYLVYFTGLYEVALRNHWAHLAMYGHFVAVGLLFAFVIIGVDPAPRSLPYWQRMIMLFATTPFHAFFGVIILSSSTLIAADWFLDVGWSTASELLSDQQLGGGVAWAVGELVVLVIVSALFVQWARSDEREARRRDRAADRAAPEGDDELARYNEYLRRLAEADQQRR